MRTSYKKNRPFDFKLIDLVEPNPVLYQRTGLSNYETMKAKTVIWEKIAQLMGRNVEFCLMRWNNLRYQFQKELRRAEKPCPKDGVLRGSTWPYLERLQFLADVQPKTKPKTLSSNNGRQRQVATAATSAAPEQEVWQTYSDCVVMNVNQEEPQRDIMMYINNDERYIIEEIIEGPNEQIIQEEIIYEDDEEQQHREITLESSAAPSAAASLDPPEQLDVSPTNFLKMDSLLAQLKNTQRERAERRIFAFLLKCQLRSLLGEPVEDLVI